MRHLCPHPGCGRSMAARGRPAKRYLAGGGRYVICPNCRGIAQVLGSGDRIVYIDVPSVGACAKCGLPIPQPLPGARRKCLVCDARGG